MSDLNITTVQMPIIWKDAQANLTFLDDELALLKTDVIILPEMFNTGFCMEPKSISETMNGKTVQWMIEKAKVLNTVICGSVCISENNLFYNRFLWVTKLGVEYYYDKKHCFTLAGEDKVFTAGNQPVVIEYKGWKIRPFVCYDLRFPVWSRNTQNYDLAIYVANWPAKRSFAWKSLLTARAIENMSYTIGVNRIGMDGNHLNYQGDSMVLDGLGNLLCESKNEALLQQITIKKAPLNEARNHFKFLDDMDAFDVK